MMVSGDVTTRFGDIATKKYRWWAVILLGTLMSTLMLPLAHAHLMVAQRGTLNIVGDSVFMVLSLPVSAFTGADDDGDGLLTSAESQARRPDLVQAVLAKVRLLDEQGARPLEGLMLSSVSPDDHAPMLTATQLAVMDRFALNGTDSDLRFQVDLHGIQAVEQQLDITVTRAADARSQSLQLSPKASFADVRRSDRSVEIDHLIELPAPSGKRQ